MAEHPTYKNKPDKKIEIGDIISIDGIKRVVTGVKISNDGEYHGYEVLNRNLDSCIQWVWRSSDNTELLFYEPHITIEMSVEDAKLFVQDGAGVILLMDRINEALEEYNNRTKGRTV